jgi:hypothetical protein
VVTRCQQPRLTVASSHGGHAPTRRAVQPAGRSGSCSSDCVAVHRPSRGYRESVWLFSRRALLFGLREASRLGLRRSSTTHRSGHLGGEPYVGHLPSRAPAHPCPGGCRPHHADRRRRGRTGHRSPRVASGGLVGCRTWCLVGRGPPAGHECVGATLLDRTRLDPAQGDADRRSETLDCVRVRGWPGSREQVFHRVVGACPPHRIAALPAENAAREPGSSPVAQSLWRSSYPISCGT